MVLLNFERVDVFKRTKPLDKENIRGIRNWLAGNLGPRESVVFKGDQELIMFLPGTTAEDLSPRVLVLSEAFQRWKVERGSGFHNLQMSIGYSTCEEGDDLTRTLEIASVTMHPELSQDLDIAAQS